MEVSESVLPDNLCGGTAIFTISSNNYMPYSRTFIDSSNAVHAEADHFLCLVDKIIPVENFYPEDCTILEVCELNIPDFSGFSFRYDIMEFNTAAKPFMFLHLFALGYDSVIYFDPDIKVYRPITPVFDALIEGASVVLTPHLTRPAETDITPNDLTMMQAGIYNLGFVAFRKQVEVEDVLRWWARRLRYQCINAQALGIFVDQKFIDLVPGFLDHVAVLRTPTLNVAYWNLAQRDLERDQDHWLVDGQPLIFFHFSGYDPRNSQRLSKYTVLFSDANSSALQALLDDYQSDLFARELDHTPRAIFAYDRFASGAKIPTLARHIFRDDYLTWEGDPFATFERHLGQPAIGIPAGSNGSVCTNLMLGFWKSSSLLQNSYDVRSPDGVADVVRWMIDNGHASGLDSRLMVGTLERLEDSGRNPHRPVPSGCAEDGADISVIGYLTANSGVGEAGRLALSALAAGERSVDAVNVSLNVASSRDNFSCEAFLRDKALGRVQIFHVNADQLPSVQDKMAGAFRQDAYRIAVPFWELAKFPAEWLSHFNQVDEIWAPTRFIQNALINKIDKPVIRMPIAFDFERPAGLGRSRFGLPDGRFVFLFSFDFLSFSGRKNPAAVLQAFTHAFAGRRFEKDVVLVIKCVNSALAQKEVDALRRDVDRRLDIRFIDQELSRTDMLGLIGAVDCVVSLHRSEGLGLLIAEAMALGVPVIATDYSATVELISPDTGYPVDFKLIELGPDDYPFARGQVWADPDLSHAAWQMHYVVEQAGKNGDLIERARRFVATEHGLQTVTSRQESRFQELGI